MPRASGQSLNRGISHSSDPQDGGSLRKDGIRVGDGHSHRGLSRSVGPCGESVPQGGIFTQGSDRSLHRGGSYGNDHQDSQGSGGLVLVLATVSVSAVSVIASSVSAPPPSAARGVF